jgi:Domain of unknown function (DUF4082)/Bacterial Ig-like domain/Divergent InlB B-repeat domain/Protein of unknown function (DUF1036)
MIKIRSIVFLFVGVLLSVTNANAAAPRKVAIFVNGYRDCCIGFTKNALKDTLKDLDIESFKTPWNSVFPISGDTSQNQAGKVTVGATQNFVDQMKQYFATLPDGSEVYLFGHSFGGDSILQFLEQYRRTRVKIRLVALIDPVMLDKAAPILNPLALLGLRPRGYVIPSNVDYFFNRWQRNDVPPFNFKDSGSIQCNATNCDDQKEQSKARKTNGDTNYIPCRWLEFTCPGYRPPIPFITTGSRGQKQQRLHHGTFQSDTLKQGQHGKAITSDAFIADSLIKIIKELDLLPPPPLPSKVQLCNESPEEMFYARLAFDHNLTKWVGSGWNSIDAFDCETENFGLTRGKVYYYAGNANGLAWPVENNSSDVFFCANRSIFSILNEDVDMCIKKGNFFVRGAEVNKEPGIVTTVNILPKRLIHTLTVKNTRTNLGFGRVTSFPSGIDCGGTCSANFNGGHIAGTVTLTALADDGSNFAGWSGCTLVVKNRCKVVMTQDKVVEAHFTDQPVMVIGRRGTGNGNVISSPAGINCGFDCIQEYANGDNIVTLKPEPADGSLFKGWFGFQAKDCKESVSCTVNVDSFHFLIAEFEAAPTNFTLDVSKNGTGSGVVFSSNIGIDCGEDCSENYVTNAQVELIALPDRGAVFRGWNGACSGTSPCKITMYNDKEIRATFATANPRVFIVSNRNDDGIDSLRQAILDANSNAGDDTIVFIDGLKGEITLINGELDITDSVVIDGPGANVLSISGNKATRIFKIDPGTIGTVDINGLTLKDGNDLTGNGGGAIIIESGTVTLNQVTLNNNSANTNSGGGGGIRKFGPGALTISNSTISGNSAIDEFDQGAGGGIKIDQGKGKLTINNSTVSGNSAANGGGIALDDGTLTVNNSTIAGNTAIFGGGGIFNGDGTLILSNSIIAGNTVNTEPTEKDIQNFGSLLSLGHNLLGENGNSGVTADSVLASTDLILAGSLSTVLEPLTDNGGPTLTHLPVVDGTAINAGGNNLILDGIITDQRGPGFLRNINTIVDIGAVEYNLNDNDDDGILDEIDDDDDNGGAPDDWEREHGFNPLDADDDVQDPDNDGLSNIQELLLGTDPNNSDSDHDGLSDSDDPAPLSSFTLTVSKIGSGSGRITSSVAGIDCGIDCSENYPSDGNSLVTLSANADSNAAFRGWSGACSGSDTCTITMSDHQEITATFVPVTPFLVSNLDDNGPGSFRQAILDANANPEESSISFSPELSGTITLTSGQLSITDSVAINGLGANVLAISGNNATRILKISPGSAGIVTVFGLTLKEGNANLQDGGGAILVDSGTITINHCTLSDNFGFGGGGGIRKTGPGAMTISNSTLSNNSVRRGGFIGSDFGGGIKLEQGMLTIDNSTVSGNKSARGGGISVHNDSILILNSSTVTSNSASVIDPRSISGGGGIFLGGVLILSNSIIAGNSSSMGKEIQNSGTLRSLGHNLFGENGVAGVTSGTTLADSDLILSGSINTVIGPLANNGGPTLTHLLIDGGPAIDAGKNNPPSQRVTTDQRGIGFFRVNDGTIDIGAIESAARTNNLNVDLVGGNGSVTSNPEGIDCGSTCSTDFASDTSVTLTAIADFGYLFSGWSGGGCTGTGTCIVAMNKAHAVTANFVNSFEQVSFWNQTAAPSISLEPDPNAVELGVKFTSAIDGYITGILFYKITGNDGIHIGNLWSGDVKLLATTTFSTETESGWQRVNFDEPVKINAETLYVASYFAPQGNYAVDPHYFKDTGLSNGPVQLLQNGINGGNGVYIYSPVSTFPSSSYQSSNYWVDVLFSKDIIPDKTAPMLSSVLPADSTVNVKPDSNIQVIFNEAMDISTITPNSSNFILRDKNKTLVPAKVTYNAFYKTATLKPDKILTYGETYSVLVKGGTAGGRDLTGNTIENDFSWSFTTEAIASCPCSLWNDTVIPERLTDNDTNAIELGVKFSSGIDGNIAAIRFYKSENNTGIHVGSLWNEDGALLAQATFTNETASGWQQVNLDPPVFVGANTQYVASYHTNKGHYSVDNQFFSAAKYSNSPLTALRSDHKESNGLYLYGSGGFPSKTWQGSNYWVDVVFVTEDKPISLTSVIPKSTLPSSGVTKRRRL